MVEGSRLLPLEGIFHRTVVDLPSEKVADTGHLSDIDRPLEDNDRPLEDNDRLPRDNDSRESIDHRWAIDCHRLGDSDCQKGPSYPEVDVCHPEMDIHRVMDIGHRPLMKDNDHHLLEEGNDHRPLGEDNDHFLSKVGIDHRPSMVDSDHRPSKVGNDLPPSKVDNDRHVLKKDNPGNDLRGLDKRPPMSEGNDLLRLGIDRLEDILKS